MSKKISIEWLAYSDSDGEPWAIFCHGHVPLEDMRPAETNPAIVDALAKLIDESREKAASMLKGMPIAHRWITDVSKDDEEADADYPWHWCIPDAAGAIPITGVRF